MRREFHVRFCEGGRVRFPSATRLLKLTAGCALEATGTIVPSPAKGQPFEMQASAGGRLGGGPGYVSDPAEGAFAGVPARRGALAAADEHDCGGPEGSPHAAP